MAVYFYLGLFLTFSWLVPYFLFHFNRFIILFINYNYITIDTVPRLYALHWVLEHLFTSQKQKRKRCVQMAGYMGGSLKLSFIEKFLLNWLILKTGVYKNSHAYSIS